MFDKYLDKFMPSKDIREYLKRIYSKSNAWDIMRIIWFADATIQDKLAALKELEQETTPEERDESDTYYLDKISNMTQAIEYALDILKNDNGVYTLETSYYDSAFKETYSEFDRVYATFEEALEEGNIITDLNKGDFNGLAWCDITKWEKSKSGKMDNRCTYTIIDSEIRYIDLNTYNITSGMLSCAYLNIPVPFKTGDIIFVDEAPFSTSFHSLIVDIGDNKDCCCIQAVAKDDHGLWHMGALKHDDIGPRSFPWKLTLYVSSLYDGELPEEEKLLKKASDILKAHPEYSQEFMYRMRNFNDEQFDAFLDSLGNVGYIVPGPYNCQPDMQ